MPHVQGVVAPAEPLKSAPAVTDDSTESDNILRNPGEFDDFEHEHSFNIQPADGLHLVLVSMISKGGAPAERDAPALHVNYHVGAQKGVDVDMAAFVVTVAHARQRCRRTPHVQCRTQLTGPPCRR